MCELLVGLPAVIVLGVVDERDGPLRVHVETRGRHRPYDGCGGVARVKERPAAELVDLPYSAAVPGWSATSIDPEHSVKCKEDSKRSRPPPTPPCPVALTLEKAAAP